MLFWVRKQRKCRCPLCQGAEQALSIVVDWALTFLDPSALASCRSACRRWNSLLELTWLRQWALFSCNRYRLPDIPARGVVSNKPDLNATKSELRRCIRQNELVNTDKKIAFLHASSPCAWSFRQHVMTFLRRAQRHGWEVSPCALLGASEKIKSFATKQCGCQAFHWRTSHLEFAERLLVELAGLLRKQGVAALRLLVALFSCVDVLNHERIVSGETKPVHVQVSLEVPGIARGLLLVPPSLPLQGTTAAPSKAAVVNSRCAERPHPFALAWKRVKSR
eukprot:TRINITY_DN3126_c0_g1_i1.p1 TRINITY_DN3126_c0_g1~~TRINITY_DN3126_c0_g1_i1.p1  ORF type:complete len:279 (-),score=34.24 TRINITY_DN3126_c0_g1_i1:388-1224(-)